jgi:hypothetical protein
VAGLVAKRRRRMGDMAAHARGQFGWGFFLRLCEGIGYCSKTSGIAVVLATSVNIVICYRHAEPNRKQWDQFAW